MRIAFFTRLIPRAAQAALLASTGALLAACAVGGTVGDAEAVEPWPAKIVAAERLRPAGALRVSFPTRDVQHEVPSGTVVLRLAVGDDGRVRQVRIAESSGYASLDASAARAMVGARFQPYREDGVATAVTTLMPMRFRPSGRCLSLGTFDC